MSPCTPIRVGAALGALAVVAGAFGAHALQGRLADKALATYEIAVRYQIYHALAWIAPGNLRQFDILEGDLAFIDWLETNAWFSRD